MISPSTIKDAKAICDCLGTVLYVLYVCTVSLKRLLNLLFIYFFSCISFHYLNIYFIYLLLNSFFLATNSYQHKCVLP